MRGAKGHQARWEAHVCLAVLSCVRVRALVTKHRFVQGVMKVCASREKSEIVCVCVLCVCVCVFMWDESAAVC